MSLHFLVSLPLLEHFTVCYNSLPCETDQHIILQPCELSFPCFLPPCQALAVFQSCLLSWLTGPASHDECGTGPSPGSCHYPMTIYYPLSVGTINPSPGNRDLSVLHYQDLPMSPSFSVTWRTYAHTHTHISVCVGYQFLFLYVAHCFSYYLHYTHRLPVPFTCPFVPCHTLWLS